MGLGKGWKTILSVATQELGSASLPPLGLWVSWAEWAGVRLRSMAASGGAGARCVLEILHGRTVILAVTGRGVVGRVLGVVISGVWGRPAIRFPEDAQTFQGHGGRWSHWARSAGLLLRCKSQRRGSLPARHRWVGGRERGLLGAADVVLQVACRLGRWPIAGRTGSQGVLGQASGQR